MEKRKEQINLKTNLKDVQINIKLRGYIFQNFSEITNTPIQNKQRLTLSTIKNRSQRIPPKSSISMVERLIKKSFILIITSKTKKSK